MSDEREMTQQEWELELRLATFAMRRAAWEERRARRMRERVSPWQL